jgi:nicotinate-nucleotide adenylyltransferase
VVGDDGGVGAVSSVGAARAALLPPATTVLFGGSFDPPHLGHQMACLYLLEGLGAADLWLLPAATHPFGKVLTAFAQRLLLCEALVAPFGGRATVQPIEAELGGAGRTFDTVCALQARHPGRPAGAGCCVQD